MDTIQNDLSITHRIIYGNERFNNHGKVFFHSNEELPNIFSGVSIEEKDILTVLASGDQVFHFYDKGAKNVDTFDINKLTFYHYFLRMWTIKYIGLYYPSNNTRFVRHLLELVEPVTEQEKDAFKYWQGFIKFFDEYDFDMNPKFYYHISRKLKDYNRIDNLQVIKEKVEQGMINFYNIDISKDFTINKKYDIVYTSNIIQWIDTSYETILRYGNNLYNLLNQGGFVLCYNSISDSGIEKLAELMDDKFDLSKINNPHYNHNNDKYVPGCMLIKK